MPSTIVARSVAKNQRQYREWMLSRKGPRPRFLHWNGAVIEDSFVNSARSTRLAVRFFANHSFACGRFQASVAPNVEKEMGRRKTENGKAPRPFK